MNGLLRIAGGLDLVVRRLGLGFGWLIVPLILIIMFDVVTRKLDYTRLMFSDFTQATGYSVSTILQDLEWHLHGALLLMSFGVGYLANAHVRVDVFRELTSRRMQAKMEFWLLLFMATPCLLVLIWYSFAWWELSWLQREGSDSLTGVGMRYIIKFFLPIGFVMAMLAVLATMFRLAAFLYGDRSDQDLALEGLEIFADNLGELEAARRAAEEALKAEADAERKGR